MTTKFYPKNSPPKKNILRRSLHEVQKKAIQNKKLILDQSKYQIHNKTSTILQVPPINLSKLSNCQTSIERKIKTSHSPVRPLTPQKGHGLFTKRHQLPTERLKTVSTCEQLQHSRYLTMLRDMMIPQSMAWKKVDGKLHKLSSSISVKTVSSNFLESFRVVINEMIESYFIGILLKKKINHLRIEIWNYILKKAGIQIDGQKRKLIYHQISKDNFCNGLKNIFKDEFKSNQIQAMVSNYFSYDSIVFYSQMEEILSFQKDSSEELIEMMYEKRFSILSSSQMVRLFLKRLIQYVDLEKKLQLICKANENDVIKFLSSLNQGNLLDIYKLARFLHESGRSSPLSFKIAERKVINFFDKILKKKLTKFELIKWLKLHEKLLH